VSPGQVDNAKQVTASGRVGIAIGTLKNDEASAACFVRDVFAIKQYLRPERYAHRQRDLFEKTKILSAMELVPLRKIRIGGIV